jgi:hypothetical protein
MTDKEALLEALEALYYCEALNRDADERKMQAITVIRKLWTEHAMRETQRLGQEIEPDDIASILACRDMLDAQPVPPRTWVGSGDLEDSNAYLIPPQRKPLTVQEIAAFVGTHQYGPEQLKWFRLGEAAHGIKETK